MQFINYKFWYITEKYHFYDPVSLFHLPREKAMANQHTHLTVLRSILLAALIAVGLSACGGGGGSSASTTPSGVATSNYTLPTAISAVPPQK